ncbi:hypothetical protein AVEN_203293-1 [Araneus ventricosus]|uniref:Uncharacterized protein n=1 Tax=Araneus ventricosus TaxID=182803 RepID=A0A4Y2HLS5_ARAVE|nr:hypothetical protein AVEN_203293-1 [Araneus ventricosus]
MNLWRIRICYWGCIEELLRGSVAVLCRTTLNLNHRPPLNPHYSLQSTYGLGMIMTRSRYGGFDRHYGVDRNVQSWYEALKVARWVCKINAQSLHSD